MSLLPPQFCLLVIATGWRDATHMILDGAHLPGAMRLTNAISDVARTGPISHQTSSFLASPVVLSALCRALWPHAHVQEMPGEERFLDLGSQSLLGGWRIIPGKSADTGALLVANGFQLVSSDDPEGDPEVDAAYEAAEAVELASVFDVDVLRARFTLALSSLLEGHTLTDCVEGYGVGGWLAGVWGTLS